MPRESSSQTSQSPGSGVSCALLALLGVHLAPFLPHLGVKLGKLGPVLSLLVPILPTLAHLLANSQLHSVFISLCFYLAVQALLVTGMQSSYLMFQYSTNFASYLELLYPEWMDVDGSYLSWRELL